MTTAAYNVALSETHVFGSSVVHEIRLGVNSLRTNKQPLGRGYPNEDYGLQVESLPGIEGLSRINLGGALSYAPLGEFQFNPNDKTAGTFQVLDNFSIARGAHTIKTGADLRWVRSDSIGAQFARGIFTFNGRFTGSSFGDFLLGMTSGRQFSTVQFGNLRERDYMFYAQDDWRIARQLTLNLGLRYELASPRFDTLDRMSALDPSVFPEVRVIRAGEAGRSWSDRALVRTDTNNWAPRIGLAYQPAEVWTVRAAWGLFYGMPKGAGPAVHLLNNWPESREVTVPSTAATSAGQLSDGIDASLLGSATQMPANLSWSVWSPDFTTPTISQWNLSVQRQLGPSWVVTTAYVGSSSRHLQRMYNMNAAGPGDSRTERERRMIPSLGAITMTDSAGSASYHGLQATMDKRLSHGWQGALVVHLEPLDRRRAGTRRGRRERGDPGLAQHSGRSREFRLRSAAPAGCARRRRSPLRCRSPLVAAAEVRWASCSATGSCRRSSRRSQGPTSTSRCSIPRTASESRSAAACGGPIWWVIQPCRIRRLTRG